MDDDQQSHRCEGIAARTDDPEVRGPTPEQRYRPHRERTTMSIPRLLLSTIAVGQNRPSEYGQAEPVHHCRGNRGNRPSLASTSGTNLDGTYT
jgi:hypothetical protein